MIDALRSYHDGAKLLHSSAGTIADSQHHRGFIRAKTTQSIQGQITLLKLSDDSISKSNCICSIILLLDVDCL